MQSQVENNAFEIGEVFTGPDECEIVLLLGHTRFILIIKKPDCQTRGDVVADFFLKLEGSEHDPDDLAYERCLEDFRELAISASKDTMYKMADSVRKPHGSAQNLEDFLYPTTFYLQLHTVDGHLHAFEVEDTSEYADTHDPALLPMNCVPQSIQNFIPASDLEFIKDLYMGKVLKVSKNGKIFVFKSATCNNEDQLKREIDILQQANEKWESDPSNRPSIPRLLGLVTCRDQIAGILEEFIDGEILHELEMEDPSIERRQSWKTQIEENIAQLHREDLIWGDVKPENILVDKAERLWLIDFGGSSTDGWVDRDQAETVKGDLQGLQRLVEYLGFKQ